MTTVLIADDNRQISSILAEYARDAGLTPLLAYDGDEAINLFEQHAPDIVLLDVMMPKRDGFEVCKHIRTHSNVPIIMITARGEDFERIMGLEIGADDYIVKPFSPRVVMAHIQAVMRRVEKDDTESQRVHIDSLQVDLDTYTASIDGHDIRLSKKELEILWTFARHEGRVYSREQLLHSLWGYDYFGDTRTVDTHIKRLRAKLAAWPHPTWDITTIWGVGYKLTRSPDER